MRQKLLLYAVAYLAWCSVSKANDDELPFCGSADHYVVVIYQPFEIVCSGITTYSTAISTETRWIAPTPAVVQTDTTLANPAQSAVASQPPSDGNNPDCDITSDSHTESSTPARLDGPASEAISGGRTVPSAASSYNVPIGNDLSAPATSLSGVGIGVGVGSFTTASPSPPSLPSASFTLFNTSSSGFTTLLRTTTAKFTTASATTSVGAVGPQSSLTWSFSSSAGTDFNSPNSTTSTMTTKSSSTWLEASLNHPSSEPTVSATTATSSEAGLLRPTTLNHNSTVPTTTGFNSGTSSQTYHASSNSSIATTFISAGTSTSAGVSANISTPTFQPIFASSTTRSARLNSSSIEIASTTTTVPPAATFPKVTTTQDTAAVTLLTESTSVSSQGSSTLGVSSIANLSIIASTSAVFSTSQGVSTISSQTRPPSSTALFSNLSISTRGIASTTLMPPQTTLSSLTHINNATVTANTESIVVSSRGIFSHTTTSTSTSTVPQTPTGACSFSASMCPPSGLTVKLYANSAYPSDGYGVSDGISGVGASYYLSQKPIAQGKSDSLSVAYQDSKGITVTPFAQPNGVNPYFQYFRGLTQTYGGITYDANNFTLVFTGYFVPSQTGTHTFCARYADNRDTFYIGRDTAFPCGTSSNDAISSEAEPLLDRWWGSRYSVPCGSLHLVAGYYYPIRSVFGNWGTPSQLGFTVTTPDGIERRNLGEMLHPDSCST